MLPFTYQTPAVYRKITVSEVANLINKVIKEAESEQGTWNVDTLLQVEAKIDDFVEDDAKSFMGELEKKLCDNECPISCKFKIAQMISNVKAKNNQIFTDYLASRKTFYANITQKLEALGNIGLYPVTVRLIRNRIIGT